MLENEYIEKDEKLVDPVQQKDVSGTRVSSKKKLVKPISGVSKTFTEILNGEFLTKDFVLKNLGFIFFVIALLLLTVAKGYYGKQLTRDVEKTQIQLDETVAEYVESKAKLEEVTSREKLISDLNKDGLRETVNPTKVIRIRKKNNE